MNQEQMLAQFISRYISATSDKRAERFMADLTELLEKVAQDAHDHVVKITEKADATATPFAYRQTGYHPEEGE